MSDLGDMIATAIAIELTIIVVVAAVVFGGIGWVIGHFIF